MSSSAPRVADAPHGTLAGYVLGCRCLWCTSAKTATVGSDQPPSGPLNAAVAGAVATDLPRRVISLAAGHGRAGSGVGTRHVP